MKNQKQRLLVSQLDEKLNLIRSLENIIVPRNGWVSSIRIALKMSLRQLGERLNISPQSVKEIEQREANGSITLKSLREVANVFDMKLVYGLIPKNESVEKMIEKRAQEIAREIVLRTSNTMSLEDQKVSEKRIHKAIQEKADEIINKMPKYLWD